MTSATHTLRHALPEELPYPWAWPARLGQRGYWMLGFGHTRRPLHRLAFELAWPDPPDVCHWCSTSEAQVWVIDHVDADKSNNHPSNLVRACQKCNLVKGADWWGVGYAEPRLYRMPVHTWGRELTYEDVLGNDSDKLKPPMYEGPPRTQRWLPGGKKL